MQKFPVSNTNLSVSVIGFGCMNLGGAWNRQPFTGEERSRAIAAVETALDVGVNFFDHADIYTFGKSEAIFAEIWQLHPGLRKKIVLQSKCGIRFADDSYPGAPQRYDFSDDHIIHSTEQILKRLKTDYLDILLLHRPDPLMAPEEVARAFAVLHAGGKVRHFGVSNFTARQVALLQKYLDQPLVVNQVELNLLHHYLINEGVVFNQDNSTSHMAEGTLEYCRLHNMLVQAWSPVAKGRLFGQESPDQPAHINRTRSLVAQLAAAKNTSQEAIVLSWLLRHPAKIQPIIGTTRPERIRAASLARTDMLSRDEWYTLFTAARGAAMP